MTTAAISDTAERSARNRNAPITQLALASITPNPRNPRTRFEVGALAELAESIRELGLLEPLIVRQIDASGEKIPCQTCGGMRSIWKRDPSGKQTARVVDCPDCQSASPHRYEIVAGERRFRAVQLLEWTHVPCRILELDDVEAMRATIVENLQREQLDPIEEAQGYAQLQQLMAMTQGEIGAAVKRSRSAVANHIRLLDLPEEVQTMVRDGRLSPAHGIALARYKDFPAAATAIAKAALAEHFTAHDIEKKLPLPYSAEIRNATQDLRWGNAFSVEQHCHNCSRKAYRKIGDQSICLDPAHYRELTEQARAENQRASDLAIAAAKESGEVLNVRQLASGSWESLAYPGPPSECFETCPSRRQALGYGGQLETICCDSACYKRLRAADQERKVSARKERQTNMRARLKDHLEIIDEPAPDRRPGVGEREMAMVGVLVLKTVPAKCAREALRRNGIEVPKGDFTRSAMHRETLTALIEAEPDALLAALVDAVCSNELDSLHQEYNIGSFWSDWYLGLDSSGKGSDPAADEAEQAALEAELDKMERDLEDLDAAAQAEADPQ